MLLLCAEALLSKLIPLSDNAQNRKLFILYVWSGCHLNKHSRGSSLLVHKKPECAATNGSTELWPWRVTESICPSVIGQKGPFALHLTFGVQIFFSVTAIKPLDLALCFQAYLSTPIRGFWKLEKSWSVLALTETIAELVTLDPTGWGLYSWIRRCLSLRWVIAPQLGNRKRANTC